MKRAVGWSIALVAIAACGGKSVLHEGDDSSSGGDSGEPNGGYPGAGGTFGAAPAGGNGTSGTSDGGVSIGGSQPFGGTTPLGGSAPTGGTGIGAAGQGGVVDRCADVVGLPPRSEGIAWDSNGVITWQDSAFGIQGAWYSADDCANVPLGLGCTSRDPSLLGPDGRAGWSTNLESVCTKGVATLVQLKPNGAPAYAEQWGTLLGFSLNAGLPWDAILHCVEGLRLDIVGTAPNTVRVMLSMPSTEATQHFVEVLLPQRDIYLPFGLFTQGNWAKLEPFDPTKLTNLQFLVVTNTNAPTPFDFCVENVRLVD